MNEPTRKPRVAVVFGGRSSEHAISCVTAGSVLQAIDREKYDVVPVGIATDGRWVLESGEPERLRIGGPDHGHQALQLPGDTRHHTPDARLPFRGEDGGYRPARRGGDALVQIHEVPFQPSRHQGAHRALARPRHPHEPERGH